MSVEPRERAEAAPAAPRAGDFSLAGRIVQPARNRVVSPLGAATLEPKVMSVLLLLASRPGEVITKEELFREVWESAFVTEDVLTRAIGELRRTFGDTASAPRVIETIRKSGYRLVAPVEPASPVAPVEPATLLAPAEPATLLGPAEPSAAPGDEPAHAQRTGSDAVGEQAVPHPRRQGPRPRSGALRIALAAGLAGAAVVLVLRRLPAPAPAMRVRPLTTTPGDERDPAVSPDGSRVAFAWNGGSGEAHSLYVQMVDGDAPLRLTTAPGFEDRTPAWSPDGQRIAFTRSRASDCRILIVSALGGAERPLAQCGDRDYRRLAWSPDGRWLALPVRDASASSLRIELLSPDTLERRRVTAPPAGLLGDTSPSFSPDGREIAFCRNVTDGVGDIYRAPLQGGDPVRLTSDDRDLMGLEWAPDGRSILFSSSRAGIYSIWRVSSGGGTPTFVAGGGAKMKHPSVARGRNLMAYESWTYEVGLWSVPTAARAAPFRLTAAADEWDFQPHVAPDGRRVAFVSTRSGSHEIWVVGESGGAPVRITSFRGARIETPRWSPDGRRLVFSAREGARARLYTIAAAGGVAEAMPTGDADAVAPAWSHDGRAIYFASRRSGASRVWRLDLTSRALTAATGDGGYAAQEAPDGSALFYTRADAAGIWKQAAGGAPERVVASLGPEDWANWQVTAAGLYYRELCGDHPDADVVFLPFGGAPTHVASLTAQGWPGFSVSADGKTLVYPRVERHTCDLRIIENPS
ncbi:MAG: winged helix-turn-helix domain-containing protein [Acidobacteriota bacterium]